MTAGQRGDGAGVDLDLDAIEALIAVLNAPCECAWDSDHMSWAADRLANYAEPLTAELRESRAALAAANERAEAAEAKLRDLRGEIHHNVNPVIGQIRWHEAKPEIHDANYAYWVEKLTAATDAADAALGERPMRDQLADAKSTDQPEPEE